MEDVIGTPTSKRRQRGIYSSARVVTTVTALSAKGRCMKMRLATSPRTVSKKQAIAKERLHRKVEETTRRCPGCRAPIEKTKGCDHMTCIQCRHELFWLCPAPCRGERGILLASDSQARGKKQFRMVLVCSPFSDPGCTKTLLVSSVLSPLLAGKEGWAWHQRGDLHVQFMRCLL